MQIKVSLNSGMTKNQLKRQQRQVHRTKHRSVRSTCSRLAAADLHDIDKNRLRSANTSMFSYKTY